MKGKGQLANYSFMPTDPLNNEKFCENSIYFDLGAVVSGNSFVETCLLLITLFMELCS